jgi:hypothetical protein
MVPIEKHKKNILMFYKNDYSIFQIFIIYLYYYMHPKMAQIDKKKSPHPTQGPKRQNTTPNIYYLTRLSQHYVYFYFSVMFTELSPFLDLCIFFKP